MSYAQAAHKGPKQSPDEVSKFDGFSDNALVGMLLTECRREYRPNKRLLEALQNQLHELFRAPAPPEVDDSSSSYTDLDGEHLKSEASETAQATKEKSSEAAQTSKEKGSEAAQTARDKASEAADYTKEKSSQFADSASTNYNKAKKEAKKDGKKAKKEIKGEYNEVYENRDNPVVIANGIAICVGAAALGYGAYSKHQVGELTWQVAGVAAAVVGVLGVGDYFLSQYLFQNKYPKK